MAFPSEEFRYNMKLAWLSFVQAVYSFPPLQRVVLVFGIIALIPGYWAARLVADSYYSQSFARSNITAHPSFTSTLPLQASRVTTLPIGEKSFMGYSQITNPNLDLSVSSGTFTFTFKNKKQETLYTSSGKFYLLPGQEQYIVSPRFTPPEVVDSATLEVSQLHFQKRFDIPKISLATPAVTITDLAGPVAGVRLEGAVSNESPYVLGAVRLTFLLYGPSNKLIGVVQRDEFTVRPKERRTFPQEWPGLKKSDIVKVDPVATTNALDISNLQVDSKLVPDAPKKSNSVEDR